MSMTPEQLNEARAKMDRAILETDCTGDETLWVFRYTRYLMSVTGWSMSDCIADANDAYAAWGQDPSCTPEEIASSDASEHANG